MSNESRKIDLGTHALRVRESGGGERTFVCLHDFLDDPSAWSGIEPELAALGRVVLVQQRAHGDSSAPPGSHALADLGSDVVRLVAALGTGKAVLVGHGLGGLAALYATLQAPDRIAALALISTVSEIDRRALAHWRDVVRAGEVNKLQGLARSVFGPTSRREIDGSGAGLTEIARALTSLEVDPLTPKLGAIHCPTVLIVGERDERGVAAARRIAEQVAGAKLDIVPGQGEAPHVAAPQAVLAALRDLTAQLGG